MKGFKKGVNVGGWLAQYDVNEKEKFDLKQRNRHFAEFITEKDIAVIAEWGADHIRLSIDAEVLLESRDEQRFVYIDRCIEWCEKYRLGIILDIHEIQGHIYGQMEELIPLLKEEELQQRLIGLWELLSLRYKECTCPMMFELLNEVSDAKGGYAWNRLCRRLVAVIRRIDPERVILIGSNEQNSPAELRALELYEDPNIMYNFHFYEPLFFTHQMAHFSEDMMLYHKKIHYPDEITDFTAFLEKNPQYADRYRHTAFCRQFDRKLLEKLLKPAFDFMEASNGRLYCGEFGVIDQADAEDCLRYCKDVAVLLREHGIGYAYWNYKEMDFGLVNKYGDPVNEPLLSALFSA